MSWDEIFQDIREKFKDDWKKVAYELLRLIKEYRPAIPLSKKRLSADKIEKIREMAKQGKKAREISQELDINLASVGRYGKGYFARKVGRPKSKND